MGADLSTYLVFGFRAKKDELKKHNLKLHDDRFLPYIEGHTCMIDIIVPDSSGDYFTFGRRLSHLDFEDEAIKYIEYQNIPLTGETRRLTELFIQLFGQDIYDTLENKEPQLMHFNHWS